MNIERENALKSAGDSLSAIQTFDTKSIVRAEKLGSVFDFSLAEEPAARIIVLFKQVDPSGLHYLTTSSLLSLQSISESTRQLFQQALDFDPTGTNATSTRDSIVAQIASHEQSVFGSVSPIISYLSSQMNGAQTVLDSLRLELRGSKQVLDDLITETQSAAAETKLILEAARAASAQVGVSKEAGHFATAADDHRKPLKNGEMQHCVLPVYCCYILLARPFCINGNG